MNYQTNSGYYQQQQSYCPPQHAAYSRSCSTSNLHHYAAQQTQSSYGQYNTAASRSSSNLRQMSYTQSSQCPMAPRQHAQSGIVLQSLPNMQTLNTAALSTSANHIVSDNNSMNANLAQFAKYSQIQLQHALSQYPVWLQKEYMRRLQRQYEELYVIEDPKIHHWSAICPRGDNEHALSHPNLMGIVSESASAPSSVEYLSESVTLSPSPYAYSPHQEEQSCSPQKESKFVFDDSNDMYKSPSSTPVNNTQSTGAMLTCFQILDSIKEEDAPKEAIKIKKIRKVVAVAIEEDESRIKEENNNSLSPRVSPGNVEQQQMYQTAMQRWYQHKQYQHKQQQYQQLLMQQAMQHQQYLMQQNKYVAQYIQQQHVQCPQNQKQQQMYYARNAQQQMYCA